MLFTRPKSYPFALISLCLSLTLSSCSKTDDGTVTASISGEVTENGAPAEGVSILIGTEEKAETNANGHYEITGLETGSYTVVPAQEGRTFDPAQQVVTLVAGGLEGVDFERVPLEGFTHAGETWELFNSSAYTVKVNDATTLQLDLAQNALWYNADEGGAVFREISGDFTITATVNAVRKSDNSQAVACDVCLGGVMVRNPDDAAGENYVHLVTGFTPEGLGYETKSTINNASTFEAYEDGLSQHDLRIERSGSTFVLFKKAEGDADWVMAASYERADLPNTVQVGLNIYTAQSGDVADLSVIYENVLIEN